MNNKTKWNVYRKVDSSLWEPVYMDSNLSKELVEKELKKKYGFRFFIVKGS